MKKEEVRRFWERLPCGSAYAEGGTGDARLSAVAAARDALEPFIPSFARFDQGKDKYVLEVGIGPGVDHLQWAISEPGKLVGIDLTERAIETTRLRLAGHGLPSSLVQADAEYLPFCDGTFDIVYAWGVLHHTPNTARAFAEVSRVLRPGGLARVMIYHNPSLVGIMLWLRYGLARRQPGLGLERIYADHLESPGTKAYTIRRARELSSMFRHVRVRVELSPGDLLTGRVGRRHRGRVLRLARQLWPRPVLRRVARPLGLYLLMECFK